MKTLTNLLFLTLFCNVISAEDQEARLKELNDYWAEVSRSVKAGDFEGYRATCHENGVLVSGVSGNSQPLSDALTRWKEGFDKTKSGAMKASVEFRFSRRIGDATTAHETGIFRYSTIDKEGKRKDDYIHFEGLLIKGDKWKIMMEYQKSRATEDEWDKLQQKVKQAN